MLTLGEQTNHLIHHTDDSVFLFTNRQFGNMVPAHSDDAEQNRLRALDIIRNYSPATELVTASPYQGNFVDLDIQQASDLHKADALITTNPNHVLHMRPADCGVVAIKGFGLKVEAEVMALVHTGRHVLNTGDHLRTLDYMVDKHGLSPEQMQVYVGPSARADSYQFPQIEEEQRTSKRWRDHVWKDKAGSWHVDLHGLTISDFKKFGIQPSSITQSDIDTAASEDYFSRMKFNKGQQTVKGNNGAFFASRR
jgi:copper oxidase (laccase) domain-containing protein